MFFPLSLILKTQLQGNSFKLMFLNTWCLWIQCASLNLSLVMRRLGVPRDPYTLPPLLWVNFLCRFPSCAKTSASFEGCGSRDHSWRLYILCPAPKMLRASSILAVSHHCSFLICGHIGKKPLGGNFTSWTASLLATSVLGNLVAIAYTYSWVLGSFRTPFHLPLSVFLLTVVLVPFLMYALQSLLWGSALQI